MTVVARILNKFRMNLLKVAIMRQDLRIEELVDAYDGFGVIRELKKKYQLLEKLTELEKKARKK